jgi:internalin A
LSALKKLDISYSGVSDLLPLAGMHTLENLNLAGCTRLTSLEPIRSLKLRVLNLNETDSRFDNLDALQQMTSLEMLYMNATMVTTLEKLSQLRLTALTVAGTRLQNLEGLNPSRLGALQCQMSQINDLSVLREAKKLVVLNCGESQVHDLAPLANLPSLRDLNLTQTRVKDLSPLIGLPKLRELILNKSTGITDLSPLLKIQPLQNLVLPFRENAAGPMQSQVEELQRHHKNAVNFPPS